MMYYHHIIYEFIINIFVAKGDCWNHQTYFTSFSLEFSTFVKCTQSLCEGRIGVNEYTYFPFGFEPIVMSSCVIVGLVYKCFENLLFLESYVMFYLSQHLVSFCLIGFNHKFDKLLLQIFIKSMMAKMVTSLKVQDSFSDLFRLRSLFGKFGENSRFFAISLFLGCKAKEKLLIWFDFFN